MPPLREYERDRELAARLGDAELSLPEDRELIELVEAHLSMTREGQAATGDAAGSARNLAGGGSTPIAGGGDACAPDGLGIDGARLYYARWKPGVSLVGSWELDLRGHGTRLVSLKVHTGLENAKRRRYERAGADAERVCDPLLPFAAIEERAATLVAFPADRALRGLDRALNLRKVARTLDETDLWAPLVLRRRSSTLELLRYKPERRAVLRLDARLKVRAPEGQSEAAAAAAAEGLPRARCVGLRVLPPEHARRLAAIRLELGDGPFPRLLHFEEDQGTLFEEWLEGSGHEPDEFEHAAEAAGALARLHARRAEGDVPTRTRDDWRPFAERLAWPSSEWEALPDAPVLAGRCLIHGDFHPDQLLSTGDGPRLLDLDELRVGAPEEDLANWIADALRERPEASARDVAGELLEAYRSAGGDYQPATLRALVAYELGARAFASLRRMERGAVERARVLVDRAKRVTGEDLP